MATAPVERPARLQREHLCIDARARAIHWARARSTRRGLRPVAWGSIDRDPERSLDEQLHELAAQGLGRAALVEIALGSPRLAHERIALPPLSSGEARAVARRRCADFAHRLGDDSTCDYAMRRGEEGRRVLWLAGIPAIEAAACHATWLDRGYVLHRIQSRHLALGQLVGKLDERIGDDTVAIFDLEAEWGTCVIADAAGWIFSREIPLRFMGHLVSADDGAPHERRAAAGSAASWQLRSDAIALDDDDASDAAVAPATNDDRADPAFARHAERLATELRRTFRYVQGQVDTTAVARVLLTGEVPQLPELAHALAGHLDEPVEVFVARTDEHGMPEAVGGASVALGLALAPAPHAGNLLPAEVRSLQAAHRARRLLVRSIAAATAALALLAAGVAYEVGALGTQIEAAQARWTRVQTLRQQVEQTRRARARFAAIDGLLAAMDREAPSWSGLLQTLSHALPDRAAVAELDGVAKPPLWTVSISVDAEGTSVAAAAQSVSDLAGTLGDTPFVRVDGVHREQTRDATGGAQHARVRFRIEGVLAPVASGARESDPHTARRPDEMRDTEVANDA